MKYLKRFNESQSSRDYLSVVKENDDLSEIIFIIENSDLIDEFDNRIGVSDWYPSNMAHCLEHNLKHKTITKEEYNFYRDNTFTVQLEEKIDENDDQWNWRFPDTIYWIEPKIYKVIDEINSRIEPMGYEILFNDYGSSDTSYELLIGNKKV